MSAVNRKADLRLSPSELALLVACRQAVRSAPEN